MSAVPEDFIASQPQTPVRAARRPAKKGESADTPEQRFWQWFAIGVLLFCWIAEATLCAERGF